MIAEILIYKNIYVNIKIIVEKIGNCKVLSYFLQLIDLRIDKLVITSLGGFVSNSTIRKNKLIICTNNIYYLGFFY